MRPLTAYNRLSAAFLILGLASAGALAFSRVSGTRFTPTLSVGAGFVDTQADYLYMPLAGMKPGGLTRIRLSDFTMGGEAFSSPEEIDSGSMVIDPAARAAYVTGQITPGRIVKFNLDTFQRTAGLALNGGRWPNLVGIDTGRGLAWAYVLNGFSPRLIKLRLSDFSETVPFLNLPSEGLRALAVDTTTAAGYFVARNTVSRLVKVDLLTMTQVAELTLEAGDDVDKVAVIDQRRGFLYLAGDAGNRLVRVRLSTFERVDALTLTGNNGGGVLCGVMDPNGAILYLGRGRFPDQVVRVALDSFQVLPAMTLNAGEQGLAMAIDPRTRTMYLTTKNRPVAVTRINLSNFTRGTTLSYPLGISNPGQIIHDPARNFAYFATDTDDNSIAVSVDLADYSVRTLNLAPLTNSKTGFLDPNGQYVYFVNCFFPTRIARVRVSDWTLDGTLVLQSGLADGVLIWSSVVDAAGRRAFLASSGANPAVVNVIDLDSFTRVLTHPLPGFLNFRTGGGANGAAYFYDPLHASGLPSYARVDFDGLALSTGVIQTSLGMPPGTAAAFDPGGFAYLAGGNQVSQVRLSDMREIARLTHTGIGTMTFQSAALDPGRNAGYAGTAGAPGHVIRFSLSPFRFTGAADARSPEGFLWSGVVDSTRNAAYFTDYGWQSGLVKFNLADPVAPPAAPANARVTIARARSVRAHWSTVAEAETYELSASRNPGAFPMPIEAEQISETGIGDLAGLAPGTVYHLFMRACNSAGCSPFTPFGPFETATGPPGAGRVVGTLNGALRAEWTPTASATAYTMAAARTADNPPIPAASSVTARSEGAVGGLAPNTRYHLFVNACDGGACSEYVALGASATLANVPGIAGASAVGSAVRIRLAPNGNPAATTFEIEASADGGLSYFPAGVTTTRTAVLRNLASRTAYLLRARAVNLDGIPTAYSGLTPVTTGQGDPRFYPNPYRPGGPPLIFDGLARESAVRIFTAAGTLVRELRADGSGAAAWDGTTDAGGAATSGVFLVAVQDGRGAARTLKLVIQR